jgi:hypothetical protein
LMVFALAGDSTITSDFPIELCKPFNKVGLQIHVARSLISRGADIKQTPFI